MSAIIFVLVLFLVAYVYGRTIVFRMKGKIDLTVSLLVPCFVFIVWTYVSAGAQKTFFWESTPVIFAICVAFCVVSWLAMNGKIRKISEKDIQARK